ncbi:MAG TPA: permease-like cell division protein FtsX [Chthonomonadaceae bacterium]|nr:permease-like cell division protein FtsX [Chthonomonadaceae bacterium]
MALSSLGFLIHEAFLNIRRNGLMSLAALGTVTVALTVLGAAVWTAYRINEIAQQQPLKLDRIDVFLKTEVERPQTLAVRDRIRQLPGIRAVHLITKELAWKQMQSNEPSLTEALPDNPLPDVLEVEPASPSEVGALTQAFRDQARFPEVEAVNAAGQAVKTMLGFARVVKVIGGCAALGLFIATLFIVHNTIRLTVFARRREIRIMQLVGATSGFIRLPLLLEGLFHGVAGAAIAGGVVLFCGHEVSRFIAELQSPLVGNVPSLVRPVEVVAGLVAAGALIGLTGSYLSIRRFLKQV